jgi:acyl-CoA thioester hydrolase
MIEIAEREGPENPAVFTAVIPLRWSDLDADGIVNNAVYFRLMEETRMQWLRSLGLSATPPDCLSILRNAACSYLRPLPFPGDAGISVFITHVGRTSVRTAYTLFSPAAPQAICAEGYATIVWYNPVEKRPWPLPDSISRLR